MGRLGGGGTVLGTVWALLGAAAAAAAANQEDPTHLFSEVFVCQPDQPLTSLFQTLDDQPLFSFDFPSSQWEPRMPDFQPGVESRTSPDKVEEQSRICAATLQFLTEFSDKYVWMPENKGLPQVQIFTRQPLQLGRPNTLICSVSNTFPPSATVTWQRHNQTLPPGASTTRISPLQGLDFQVFSYLDVTPQEGDIYRCIVRTPRDASSYMGLWVPKDPVASERLEDVLCGLASAAGIVLAAAGVVLMVRTRRCSCTS